MALPLNRKSEGLDQGGNKADSYSNRDTDSWRGVVGDDEAAQFHHEFASPYQLHRCACSSECVGQFTV